MTRPDRQHFNTIVNENHASIYRICKAYLGRSVEVEDLYQEVLINVWHSLPRFKGNSKISTWIYRVTVNTAITYRRKKNRHESKWVPMEPGHPIPGSEESSKEEKIRLEKKLEKMMGLIEGLKKDQRIVIGLYLEDLSYKEIAEVLGKDTNYVGVKISRIKEKLSKMMRS